jgi:hypothetical protein
MCLCLSTINLSCLPLPQSLSPCHLVSGLELDYFTKTEPIDFQVYQLIFVFSLLILFSLLTARPFTVNITRARPMLRWQAPLRLT